MEIDRYMRCVLQDVPMFNTNIDINFDDKLMKLLSGRYIDFINAERFLIMNCCKNIKKKYNNVIFKIQYDIKNDIWLIYFSNEYRYDQNFKKYIYKNFEKYLIKNQMFISYFLYAFKDFNNTKRK